MPTARKGGEKGASRFGGMPVFHCESGIDAEFESSKGACPLLPWCTFCGHDARFCLGKRRQLTGKVLASRGGPAAAPPGMASESCPPAIKKKAFATDKLWKFAIKTWKWICGRAARGTFEMGKREPVPGGGSDV